MKNIQIIPATVEDARTIAQLNEHVHQMHVKAVPTFFKEKSVSEATMIFEQILAMENAFVFMAKEKKKPIGYTLSFLHYREETPFTNARQFMVIDQISVNPAWSGKGVGRLLLNAVLETAHQHGIEEVDATTWSFNEDAQGFFERFGFMPQLKRYSLKL